MQFIVNQQIAIEVETAEEAVEKTKPMEGTRISFSVNPRPPQQGAGRVISNSPQPSVTITPTS